MNLELQGRIALVTGGGRGLGRAIARALAREGCDVAVTSRTAAELEAVASELRTFGEGKRRAAALPCDLTDADALDRLVADTRAQLGPPSILILNAAALYQPARLHNVAAAERSRLLATDVTAAVELTTRLVPGMLDGRWGRVVALGSVAARAGTSGAALYGASKAFLEGFARGLAVDYSRYGITANVVAVGFAETERLAGRLADAPEQRERLVRATATRKLPTADEVADVVTFLCSPRASIVTGAVLDATAGSHLNNLW